MARKDQVKLFFCACIDESPFIDFLKETGVELKHWAYIRAIRLWRERIKSAVESVLNNAERQRKAAVRKAVEIFHKVTEDEVSIEVYLNFLLALAEDICCRVKNGTEKKMWEKVIENLMKLYGAYDPDLEASKAMEQGETLNKLVWEVF